MFQGLGDKRGLGEITIYQSNLKRVEVEDLKGLEVVLLLSAMAIGDIWFLPTNQMFNLNPPIKGGAGGTSRGRKNSFPLVVSPPAVTVSVPQPPTTSPQLGRPPAGASFASRFQQQQEAHQRRHSTPPDGDVEYARRLHDEAVKKRALAEQEQENIRRMIAEEEARDRRMREEEIERETERLRRIYERERQEHMARGARNAQPQRVSSQQRPPAPQRPQSQYRPQQQQRPAVVGGSTGVVPPGRTGALKAEETKKLNSRKSFLGLRFGGSSSGDKGKEKDKRKKLLKKGSSMF